MSESDSLLAYLVKIELMLSKLLSVSSTNDSMMGCLRPHLKTSEIMGNGALWLLVVPFTFFLTSDHNTKEKLLNLELALLLDLATVGILKAVIRRPRPPDNYDDQGNLLSDKYSMPSGHTSRAVLVYYFIPMHFNVSMMWEDVLRIWVILVIVSRLAMARHYPSDIIVGGVLGYLEAQIINPTAFWLNLENVLLAK